MINTKNKYILVTEQGKKVGTGFRLIMTALVEKQRLLVDMKQLVYVKNNETGQVLSTDLNKPTKRVPMEMKQGLVKAGIDRLVFQSDRQIDIPEIHGEKGKVV